MEKKEETTEYNPPDRARKQHKKAWRSERGGSYDSLGIWRPRITPYYVRKLTIIDIVLHPT